MQLFIIHFLILPIKKFKKQKLKIIFFNFLNKCNRYNIYCVSYYKGNLGKESCTYMKAYKKIISFILTLVMMLSLSVNVFAPVFLFNVLNVLKSSSGGAHLDNMYYSLAGATLQRTNR